MVIISESMKSYVVKVLGEVKKEAEDALAADKSKETGNFSSLYLTIPLSRIVGKLTAVIPYVEAEMKENKKSTVSSLINESTQVLKEIVE